MLAAIQFNCYVCICVKQVHFHSAPTIEGNRQFCIEPESSGRLRQGLQSAIEECFRCTSRAGAAFRIQVRLFGDVNKQACQWRLNTISYQPSDACCVLTLPLWINGKRDLCRPPGYGAARQLYGVTDRLISSAPPV